MNVMPALFDSRADWAQRITDTFRESFEKIMETGRLLIAAKKTLPHGEFLALVESDLPFRARTAERLMAIARDTRISTHGSHLPASWRTLYDLTRLDDEEFEEKLSDGTINPEMKRRDLVSDPSPELEDVAAAEPEPKPPTSMFKSETDSDLPNVPSGRNAIMASRQEPSGLDYFPTPPWATRALIERVFPRIGVTELGTVWEPACGEGHMSGVLQEYAKRVIATDIKDYSSDGRTPPGFSGVVDFLDTNSKIVRDMARDVDWFITNPPFEDKPEKFALRALELARVGVAMLTRLTWLESQGRFERLFGPTPPVIIAHFAERVPIMKERWEPDGSTTSAYIWSVWLKNQEPKDHSPFYWIPPGCRSVLSRPDDRLRFPSSPTAKKPKARKAEATEEPAPEVQIDLEDVPAFLKFK